MDTLESLMKNEHGFIIECEIYIPKDLCFLPVCVKNNLSNSSANKGCFYQTGFYEKQVYGHIDVEQMVSVGIQIKRITNAIVFEGSIPSPFCDFMGDLYELKKEHTAKGEDVFAKLIKSFMNIVYGKTVSKEIEEGHRFVSEKRFQDVVNAQTILDYEILENKQIMIREDSKEPVLFPAILGCVILQEARKIINEKVAIIDGFRKRVVAYTDTDSLYIP